MGFTLWLAMGPIAGAVDYGGGSVQGYSANQPIEVGTIVQLSGENSNRVITAKQAAIKACTYFIPTPYFATKHTPALGWFRYFVWRLR